MSEATKAARTKTVPTVDLKQIAQALARPFAADQVRRKPLTVQGNKALAIHYVDARLVAERLDEVVGIGAWKDSYQELPDGCVLCRLSLRLGLAWVTKEDVGGESRQPDRGHKKKAAYSDAFKRAAVKWGVGRYLYGLKQEWLPYDPAKKCFVGDAPVRPAKERSPSHVSAPAPAAPPVEPPVQPISAKQIAQIVELRGLLQVPDDAWKQIVARRGVASAREMTATQAQELIETLQFHVSANQIQAMLGAHPVPHQVQGGLAADGLADPGEVDFRPRPNDGRGDWTGGGIAYS